jgi:hypothetical protein
LPAIANPMEIAWAASGMSASTAYLPHCGDRTGRSSVAIRPSSGAWASGSARRGLLVALQARPHEAGGLRERRHGLAGAAPYLRLFGLAAGGVYLARGALAAARSGKGNGQAEPIAIARFFAENLATASTGLKDTVVAGADATLALAPEALAG